MKPNYCRILLIVASTLIATIGWTQSKEIRIEFMGNCGLYMTDGTTHIYTDFPYKSGAYNYMEFEEAELDSIKNNSIFIFTHKHADHYSKKNLKKALKEKNGQKFGVSNISDLEKLGKFLILVKLLKFFFVRLVRRIIKPSHCFLVYYHHGQCSCFAWKHASIQSGFKPSGLKQFLDLKGIQSHRGEGGG